MAAHPIKFMVIWIGLFVLVGAMTNAAAMQNNVEIYFDTGDQQVLLDQLGNFKFRDIPNLENDLKDKILSVYPKNLQGTLLLAEFHYWKTGNLEETRRELFVLKYYLRQVETLIDESDANYNKYRTIRDQAAYIESEMSYNFGNLRFKVKGLEIEKFAVIRGAQIMLQINEAIAGQASPEQAARLQFLENKFGTDKVDVYFTSYDSVSGQIYFTIDDFPMINYRETEPYAIIVNGKKRYHFDFKRDSNPVEIDWVPSWQLVEAIPPREIKLEIADGRRYSLNNDRLIASGMSYYSIENQDILPNYFINVQNNETIELHLEDNYKGQQTGKILMWTTRFLVAGGTYFLITNVRDQE